LKKLIALLLFIATPAYATDKATYYADSFVGRRTASGDIYSHNKFTAAYNHLPLGTWVKVINIKTGKFVRVLVNDRCGLNRVIDLSKSAARELGIIKRGIAYVTIEK
jgi:rare lipoprotein A